MTVQGDEQVPGEQDLAAAGQLYPGLRDGDPGGQRRAGPKPAPMASTCRGRAADSAAIAAGSARGSPPRTAITRAPATRAVVIAASIAVPRSPECTSSARRPRGGGVFVAGSIAGSVTTRMPGSAAASTFPATPTASTARGSSALIRARSMALTTAPPARAEASSSGAWALRADWAAAVSSAGRSGLATITTGAETNNSCARLPATTSAAPASTDVSDAGRRVRAARRT